MKSAIGSKKQLFRKTVLIYLVFSIFFSALLVLFHFINEERLNNNNNNKYKIYINGNINNIKEGTDTHKNIDEVSLIDIKSNNNINIDHDLNNNINTIENEHEHEHNIVSKEQNMLSTRSYKQPSQLIKVNNDHINLDMNKIIDMNQIQHTNDIPIENSGTSLSKDTMLLIICSNRPEYLKRTLDNVIKYHPKNGDIPILISEDGHDSEVNNVINQAKIQIEEQSIQTNTIIHIHHIHDREYYENGYFKLASHYKWAINQVFNNKYNNINIKRVIILEEDLLIASDFFELFAATKDLLDHDETLLAVSAWNDNGLKHLVHDPNQLYRSDFFPGLGWMMPYRIWQEIESIWPKAYWDDWLREPFRRKNRQIIRPEICRTLHIGQHGVSNSQYSEYLESILLNNVYIEFTKLDLYYIKSSKEWEDYYFSRIRTAKLITLTNLRQRNILAEQDIKIVYDKFEGMGDSFSSLARWSGAMNNIKADVPRTAYRGIVTIFKDNHYVHLIPKSLHLLY